MATITINNHAVQYQDRGEGHTLLFLHSYLWDSAMWEPQLVHFSKQYRCIAPDLWGHGASDPPPSLPTSMDELTEQTEAFLEAIGVRDYSVVGLSVGGMTAMRLALRNPAQVKALVLMDTDAGKEPQESHARFTLMMDVVEQIGGIPPPMTEQILPLFFSPQTMAENSLLVEAFAESLARLSAERVPGVIGLGRAIFSRPDILASLSEIKVPTLIMVGEHDASRPVAESERMADLIPDACLEVIPLAGHISSLEQPERVNQRLSHFLGA